MGTAKYNLMQNENKEYIALQDGRYKHMRLFVISDPHGDYSSISALLEKAGKVDLVLVAGDITNFGPLEKASELFDLFDQKILAIPGNCDPVAMAGTLEKLSVSLHKNIVSFGGMTFAGFGGSNPTPFNTPFELDEREIRKELDVLMKKALARKQPIVLLTHAPPYGTLDLVGETHVGCAAIAEYIGQVKLMICGHIHEARGIVNKDACTIVNPGTASAGFAALIDISEQDSVDGPIIKASLIHV